MNDTEAMPEKIDYNAFIRRAMRGVIRDALTQVAEFGLPSGHHFYISFNTSAEGVVLSNFLRESYPKQMTIVLQHRFAALQAGDEAFSVVLSFRGKQQRLTIPYAAILDFTDPEVTFRLQFPSTGEAKKAGGNASEPAERAALQESDAQDSEKEREAIILQFPNKPDQQSSTKSDS